jgi:O-antigen biosynthesis protein
MSTITGTIAHAVTIASSGTYSYASSLTIAGSGEVYQSSGSAAVYGASGASLFNAGYIRGYSDGVLITGSSGRVSNTERITATGAGGAGVSLTAGGYVYNSGTIVAGNSSAAGYGIGISGALGTVVNSGEIVSYNDLSWGVSLAEGGSVSNLAAGYIEGGVYISGSPGTVTNAGIIDDSGGAGIGLQEGGYVHVEGGMISGVDAIYLGATGSVTNAGTLEGTGDGIYLGAGGSVDNSGLIDGYAEGILIIGSAGRVSNTNRIAATGGGGAGVSLTAGGYVYNSGTIVAGNSSAAGYGVGISGGLGTVVNSGEIISYDDLNWGVSFAAGGSVRNLAAGDIGGGVYIGGAAGSVTNAGTLEGSAIGIDLAAGGTVVDSGSIGGTTAILFGGTGGSLLELERGYVISGSIIGSGSAGATNTLELSSALGAVTASYNGLGIVNFGFVEFAAPTGGKNETLVISNTASLPGTIEGFTAFHDIIDIRQLTDPASAVFNLNTLTDKLTITEGTQSVTLQLAGNLAGIVWQAGTDGFGGTDIEPACFARGTLILTENGEYPVEELQIGDKVLTVAGDMRRIKWIGRRGYRGAFLLRNSDLWPICVTAGALGPDVPRRDLYLSAKHALFLDGLLIPVECLVNESSIVRCDCPDEIEYFHIELETHDVILAERAPAETYVDCDNRQIFHNAHEFARLYPGGAPCWCFCAPRTEAGRDLDRIRQHLAATARASRLAA